MDQDRPEITAQLTVAELLKHYPELEPVLIEQAPMFEKIQNPVLRKTVAKVATLEKAATMARISISGLVSALRRAAGFPLDTATPEDSSTQPAGNRTPPWVAAGELRQTIDADKMLETGEHPLNLVMKLLSEFNSGALIRIESSFPPIPLVEAAQRKGHLAWTGLRADGQYETYFGVQ
jgi:hypothetical protein